MDANKPLISVILPVSNNAGTLVACLDSLLGQTYINLEIIAIDDASTDTSFKILKQYRRTDKRVILKQNIKRYGLSISLNRALKKAKGQFIAFAWSQDTSTPDRLKRQLFYLLNNPKIVAVGTQCLFVDAIGKQKIQSNFPTDYLASKQTPIQNFSVLFESMMINKYLLPKDLLRFPKQETSLLYADFFLKLTQYGQINNLPYYLYTHAINQYQSYQSLLTKIVLVIKLWLRSITTLGNRPSFWSLFSSLRNPGLQN